MCNKPAMYHTEAGWIEDRATDCLHDPRDILALCQRVSRFNFTNFAVLSDQCLFCLNIYVHLVLIYCKTQSPTSPSHTNTRDDVTLETTTHFDLDILTQNMTSFTSDSPLTTTPTQDSVVSMITDQQTSTAIFDDVTTSYSPTSSLPIETETIPARKLEVAPKPTAVSSWPKVDG